VKYLINIKGSVGSDDETVQQFIDDFVDIMNRLTNSEWELTEKAE
jgi:hypothetical protein